MKRKSNKRSRKSVYSPDKLKISIISTYKKSGYTLFSRLEFKKKREKYLIDDKEHSKKIDFYSKDVNNFENFYNVFLDEKIDLSRYATSVQKRKRAQALTWTMKTSFSIVLFILNTIIIQLIIGVTADSGTISNLSPTVKFLIMLSGCLCLFFLLISGILLIVLRNFPSNFIESFTYSKKDLLKRVNDYDYYLIQFKNIDNTIFANENFFIFIDYLIENAISKNKGFTNKMECLELELIVNDENFQVRNATCLELKQRLEKLLLNQHYALSSLEKGVNPEILLIPNKQVNIIDETVTQKFFLNYFWKKFLFVICPYYFHFYFNAKVDYELFGKDTVQNYKKYEDIFSITSLFLSVDHMFANDENLQIETRTDDWSVLVLNSIQSPIDSNILKNFFETIHGLAEVAGTTDWVELYLSDLEKILKRLKSFGLIDYVCINQFMCLLSIQLFIPDLFTEIRKFYDFDTKINNIFSVLTFDLDDEKLKYNQKFFDKRSIYFTISNLIYNNKNTLHKLKAFEFLFKNIEMDGKNRANNVFDKNQYIDISLLFNFYCETDDDEIKKLFNEIITQSEYNILTNTDISTNVKYDNTLTEVYKEMCNIEPLVMVFNPKKILKNDIYLQEYVSIYKQYYLVNILWTKLVKYMHDNFFKINSLTSLYFKKSSNCYLLYEFIDMINHFDLKNTPSKIELLLNNEKFLLNIDNMYLDFDFKKYLNSSDDIVTQNNNTKNKEKNVVSSTKSVQSSEIFGWINKNSKEKTEELNEDIIIDFFKTYKKLIYLLNDNALTNGKTLQSKNVFNNSKVVWNNSINKNNNDSLQTTNTKHTTTKISKVEKQNMATTLVPKQANKKQNKKLSSNNKNKINNTTTKKQKLSKNKKTATKKQKNSNNKKTSNK